MANEDNFLRLDSINYDTELESLLATSSLSLDDCESLFETGALTKEELEYARNWFEFYK